jgi:quinol monooxygenase YgiN
MAKLSVIATITAKPGQREALLAAFDDFFGHVESEDGTEQYVLHRSTMNPDVCFMTELYTDQAAFDAHSGSEAFAGLTGKLGGLIEAVDLQLAEPVKAVGVDL